MKRLAVIALACHVSAAMAAENLGRFFFTPEQRAQLDTMRKQRAQRPVIEAPIEQAPAAAILTYSGMVRRSDGRSTVWINNRPMPDLAHSPAEPRARVDDDGSARITLPQQRSIRLKVGQSAEIASGRIEESYTRRPPAVRLAKTPPAPPASPVLRLRRKYDDERDLPSPGSTP